MALILDASEPNKGGYIRSVLQALQEYSLSPSLDVVLVNCPDSLNDAESIIRECYGHCLDTQIVCRVLPNLEMQPWPFVYSNLDIEGINMSRIEPMESPTLSCPETSNVECKVRSRPVVALGGTFDHFHIGHKLLLTVGGLWAKHELIVGITGPELLKNKKFAEELDSYGVREEVVREFMAAVFPRLKVSPHQINDVYGPTGTVEGIDALALSQETASGGAAINKFRQEKGWAPLEVFEIGLVPGRDSTEKLSSTHYREAQALGR